jgi:hypothetical protein
MLTRLRPVEAKKSMRTEGRPWTTKPTVTFGNCFAQAPKNDGQLHDFPYLPTATTLAYVLRITRLGKQRNRRQIVLCIIA